MTPSQIVLAVASAVAVTAVATAAPAPAPLVQPAPRSGAELYRATGCYQCHGLVGQGSIISGPSLNPLKMDSGSFSRYVRNPTGAMPPYTATHLSDRDLTAIERHVRSLPRAKPYSQIPALAAVARNARPVSEQAANSGPGEGASLYATHCAACHGADRSGGVGPALGTRKTRTHEEIVALIKNPPPRMPRMFPDIVGEREVEQIATYLEQGR